MDRKNGLRLEGAVLIASIEMLRLGITAGAATAAKVFASPTLYDGRSKSLTADMNTMQCLRHLVATRVVVCSPDEHTSVGHRRKLVQTFCSPIPVLMQAKTSPSKFD